MFVFSPFLHFPFTFILCSLLSLLHYSFTAASRRSLPMIISYYHVHQQISYFKLVMNNPLPFSLEANWDAENYNIECWLIVAGYCTLYFTVWGETAVSHLTSPTTHAHSWCWCLSPLPLLPLPHLLRRPHWTSSQSTSSSPSTVSWCQLPPLGSYWPSASLIPYSHSATRKWVWVADLHNLVHVSATNRMMCDLCRGVSGSCLAYKCIFSSKLFQFV